MSLITYTSMGRLRAKPWAVPQICPTTERFKYAYAVVWEGNFTGCQWSTGECLAPLKGDDCNILSCSDSAVICPPNCALLPAALPLSARVSAPQARTFDCVCYSGYRSVLFRIFPNCSPVKTDRTPRLCAALSKVCAGSQKPTASALPVDLSI